jgi:hypothetical protein
MRTITKNIYKFSELEPDAKKFALEQWKNDSVNPFFEDHKSEIMDSLKGLFKHCYGVSLKDWQIGAYCYSSIKVSFNQDEAAELTGKRAFAWIENNLLSELRIPYKGEKRRDLAKYGSYYRPGMIKPCPFTGLCYDDDLMDDLKDSIRSGMTLKESFLALGDKAQKIMEDELDSMQTEEYLEDISEANGYEYDERGGRV